MRKTTRLVALATVGTLMLAGCGSDQTYTSAEDTPVVLTVEGTDIHAAELAQQMEIYRQQAEGQYSAMLGQLNEALSTNESGNAVSSMWRDKDMRGVLRQNGTDAILKEFALDALVKKYDLKLSEAEEATIQSQVDFGISYFGSEQALEEALVQSGSSLAQYRQDKANEYYKTQLQKIYYAKDGLEPPTDEKVQEYYDSFYFHVRSLSIPLADGQGTALSEEEQQAAQKEAQAFRDRLTDGEDFEALAAEYENAITGCNHKEYTMTTAAKLSSTYLSAASALQAGEISQVVQDTYACYIIEALPLDEDILEKENGNFSGDDTLWNEISYRMNTTDDMLLRAADDLEIKKHMTYYLIKNTNYQQYLLD